MGGLQNERWGNDNRPSSSDHHCSSSTKPSDDDNGTQTSRDHNKKHRSRSRDGLGHSRHRSRSQDGLGHSRHKSSERSHRGEGKQGSSGSLSSLSSIASSHSKSRNDRSLKSRSKGLRRNQLSTGSLDGLVQNIASIHDKSSHHSRRGKTDRSNDSLGPSSHSRKGRRDRSLDGLGTSNHSRKGRGDRSKESLHGSSGDLSIKSYSKSRSKHGSSGDLGRSKHGSSGALSIKSSGGSRSRHRSNEEFSDMSGKSRTIRMAKEDLGLTKVSDKSLDGSTMANRAKEDEEAKKRGRRAGRGKSPAPGPHTVGYKGRARPLDKDSKKSSSHSRATKPGVENVLSPRGRGGEKGKRSERLGAKTVSTHRDKGTEKAKREKARAGKKAGIAAGVGDRGLEKARREKARAGKKTGIVAGVGDRGLEKAKRAANARSAPIENLSLDPELSIDPEPSPASNDLPLAAVAVDDTANEERFEQRVQEAVGRMMKITQRGETTDNDSGVPENSRFRARDRMFVFVVVVLIVLVGGGLGFFFLWKGNMVDTGPSQSPSEPGPLRYQPPSDQECQAIREQKPVTGQDDMIVVRMTFEIEIVFSKEDDFDEYFAILVTAVQEMLVPELAGCTKPNRRAVEERQPYSHRLRRKLQIGAHPYPIANANVSAERKIGESCIGLRESHSPSIAPTTTSLEPSATTTPTKFEGDLSSVTPPTAYVTSSPNGMSETCRRGALNLELFIRNDADASSILPMIEDVFEVDGGGQSLVDKLELSDDDYQEIKFVGGVDIDDPLNESTSTPTAVGSGFLNEPTITSNSPTIAQKLEVSQEPSFKPSVQPSLDPSATPTLVPLPGSTPRPTSEPTIQTPLPTRSATKVPSSEPSRDPTFAPFPGPSPPPTPRPTSFPTSLPTLPPTPGPTLQPTPPPSAGPSSSPSSSPTPALSSQPSTADPSESPSSRPSLEPSTSPSVQASDNPSPTPSQPPTVRPLRYGDSVRLRNNYRQDRLFVMSTERSSILPGGCYFGEVRQAGFYGDGHDNFFIRSDLEDLSYAFQEPKAEECVKYGDLVYLQPGDIYTWPRTVTGERGGAYSDHWPRFFTGNAGVFAMYPNDPYYDDRLTQMGWYVRSSQGSVPDPRSNECVNFGDVVYFDAGDVRQNYWLTGGTQSDNYIAWTLDNSIDSWRADNSITAQYQWIVEEVTTTVSPPDPLEDDLDCGCVLEDRNARTLSHNGPWFVSQQGCIRYCRDQGFNFAGSQAGKECWCGDSTNVGVTDTCTMECNVRGPSACYGDASTCFCGNGYVNTLFRTSTAVSCPFP